MPPENKVRGLIPFSFGSGNKNPNFVLLLGFLCFFFTSPQVVSSTTFYFSVEEPLWFVPIFGFTYNSTLFCHFVDTAHPNSIPNTTFPLSPPILTDAQAIGSSAACAFPFRNYNLTGYSASFSTLTVNIVNHANRTVYTTNDYLSIVNCTSIPLPYCFGYLKCVTCSGYGVSSTAPFDSVCGDISHCSGNSVNEVQSNINLNPTNFIYSVSITGRSTFDLFFKTQYQIPLINANNWGIYLTQNGTVYANVTCPVSNSGVLFSNTFTFYSFRSCEIPQSFLNSANNLLENVTDIFEVSLVMLYSGVIIYEGVEYTNSFTIPFNFYYENRYTESVKLFPFQGFVSLANPLYFSEFANQELLYDYGNYESPSSKFPSVVYYRPQVSFLLSFQSFVDISFYQQYAPITVSIADGITSCVLDFSTFSNFWARATVLNNNSQANSNYYAVCTLPYVTDEQMDALYIYQAGRSSGNTLCNLLDSTGSIVLMANLSCPAIVNQTNLLVDYYPASNPSDAFTRFVQFIQPSKTLFSTLSPSVLSQNFGSSPPNLNGQAEPVAYIINDIVSVASKRSTDASEEQTEQVEKKNTDSKKRFGYEPDLSSLQSSQTSNAIPQLVAVFSRISGPLSGYSEHISQYPLLQNSFSSVFITVLNLIGDTAFNQPDQPFLQAYTIPAGTHGSFSLINTMFEVDLFIGNITIVNCQALAFDQCTSCTSIPGCGYCSHSGFGNAFQWGCANVDQCSNCAPGSFVLPSEESSWAPPALEIIDIYPRFHLIKKNQTIIHVLLNQDLTLTGPVGTAQVAFDQGIILIDCSNPKASLTQYSPGSFNGTDIFGSGFTNNELQLIHCFVPAIEDNWTNGVLTIVFECGESVNSNSVWGDSSINSRSESGKSARDPTVSDGNSSITFDVVDTPSILKFSPQDSEIDLPVVITFSGKHLADGVISAGSVAGIPCDRLFYQPTVEGRVVCLISDPLQSAFSLGLVPNTSPTNTLSGPVSLNINGISYTLSGGIYTFGSEPDALELDTISSNAVIGASLGGLVFLTILAAGIVFMVRSRSGSRV